MNFRAECFPSEGEGLGLRDAGGLWVRLEGAKTVQWDWQPAGGVGCYTAICAGAGLEATLRVRRVPGHRAAVVAHTIRNVSESDRVLTGIGMHLGFDRGRALWRIATCSGGTAHAGYPSANYELREFTLLGSGAFTIGTDLDGRSSNRFLPMATIRRDGRSPGGLWCALEWSGEWSLTMDSVTQGDDAVVRLSVAVGVRRLRLGPGEELALPAVHLGVFVGESAAGSNAIRRYIFEELQPAIRGGRPYGAVSYCSWFGLFNAISTDEMMRQASRAAELGIEVFEVDAGYFGDFPDAVGDWADVDRAKFPQGLEPVAEHVRSLGMDFGLWFEPERAMAGTWAHRAHPELFWPDPAGRPEYHLDLSLREAQDWALDWVSEWIERLGVRWIRYDANLASGVYFSSQDWSRKVQFGYVAGLYRVLEELRRRHPDLVIENCASGGRRIDFGTLARTHTNWLSDYSDDAHTCRCMVLGAQRFLPGNCCNSGIGHGRGAGDPDDIDLGFISRIIGKISIDGDVASLSPSAVRRYRHWIECHKRIRHLVVQDHYRLTPLPTSLEDWDAAQWSAYDGSEGLLACYRVTGPAAHRVALVGLDPAARYRMTNPADSTEAEASGAELMDGWEIDLGRNQAGLWHWARL